MRTLENELTDYLGSYITENKRTLIDRVLQSRTRFITVVMEDIHQSHNASAIIRTAECLGLQEVHVIEQQSKYGTNKKVLKGSYKWIDITRHKTKGTNNSQACFEKLKADGYQLLVTMPSADAISLPDFSVTNKIALVMGNEGEGVSQAALEAADYRIHIPMYGFTESFNVSVSAAICLHTLVGKLRASSLAWPLSEGEKQAIKLRWYRKCVRHAEILEKRFSPK